MDPTEIPQRPPSLGQLLRDTTSHSVVNGVVAMLFACTGPVAIIFATAHVGGWSQVERDACLLLAIFNEQELSAVALSGGFAGLGGHYLLVTPELVRQHLAAGQMVGTGYPNSRNCLFREPNRGVKWLFSNNALELAEIREQALQEIDG